MFARIFTCTLRAEKRGEFFKVLYDQVLPILKKEPGFVDVACFVSKERPDNALAVALWNTEADAHGLYIHTEPMVDLLTPLLSAPPILEHFDVQTSVPQFAVAGKAA